MAGRKDRGRKEGEGKE
uniref:IL1L1 interleukin-1 like protein 1, exons 1-6 n=1 Tax=Homo sapiens TaxID=9606 RepID=Q9NY32_HUMAN|nr:unnamed protein product [Homo sapiens]